MALCERTKAGNKNGMHNVKDMPTVEHTDMRLIIYIVVPVNCI